jgi:hypothetical protein
VRELAPALRAVEIGGKPSNSRGCKPPITAGGEICCSPPLIAADTMMSRDVRRLTMPVHDWTLVEAGIFHDFHTVWTAALRNVLNEGLLPKGYYALAEQHAGRKIADVLTLHSSPGPQGPAWSPPDTGGIAVAEAPPRVSRKQTVEPSPLGRRRSLAIRHVSGHRLIALIEIISPANKDRPRHVEDLVDKAVSALEHGVHLLVIDLFPPGLHDPSSIHGAIVQSLDQDADPYGLPPDKPLTLASYVAGSIVDIYLEHLAVGGVLVEMPLFLRDDRYINVPLESTYEGTYRGVPEFYRDVLERITPGAG